MYPVVILTGKAGAGKDVVASMLADLGGVSIAQADPLKRFARTVFQFSEEALWGPSEARNATSNHSTDHWAGLLGKGHRLGLEHEQQQFALSWLEGIGLGTQEDAEALKVWLLNTWSHGAKNGLSARYVLQTLGTEFGRARKDSVWVDYAQATARRLLDRNMTYDRTTGPLKRSGGRTEFVTITDGRFPNEILATKAAGGIAVKIGGPDAVGLSGEAARHASETEQDRIPDHWFDAVIWNDKKKGLDVLRGVVSRFVEVAVRPVPAVFTPFDRVLP